MKFTQLISRCFRPQEQGSTATVADAPRAQAQPTELTSDCLWKISSHLDFSSSQAMALTNKAMRDVFRFRQKNLELPGSQVAAALAKFPNVERVKISQPLGQAGAASLGAIRGPCEKVRHLDLRGCTDLTDQGLTTLIEKFPNITSRQLTGCHQLTDAAVRAVMNTCPNLVSLDLGGLFHLTNAAIIELAAQAAHLTELNVSSCRQLTDDDIRNLSGHCRQLTKLDVNFCRQLTDDAVINLAENLPNLTSLGLGWCNQITDNAIFVLASHCPRLTELFLGGETQVTQDAIAVLNQQRPLLNIEREARPRVR